MRDLTKIAKQTALASPISPGDIEGFSRWVLYGGFKKYYHNGRTDETHLGHDFIAYRDVNGKEHWGLHISTSIRAVADGVVASIERQSSSIFLADYQTCLIVQHDLKDTVACYSHVIPTVKIGAQIKKGQVIATLYDASEIELPSHLHLEIGTSQSINPEYPYLNQHVDPLNIIPGLREISIDHTQ